jgi:germination protein M
VKDWGTKPRQKGIKFLMYVSAILLSVLVLAGCGTLETLVQKDGEASPLAEWIGSKDQENAIPATSNLGDGKAISLYFPDATGKALIKEERTLPKTLSLARETVIQWLKGPAVKGKAQAAVDPATTLIDIAVKDGLATVDLSREFTQVYGNVSQEVAVYGLVNTLTQFPTVREVQFRIEGKALTKLGKLSITKLSYREGLVKESDTTGSTSSGITNGGTKSNSSAGANQEVKTPVLPVTGTQGSNSVLPDSPSSMNLFSFPPSST